MRPTGATTDPAIPALSAAETLPTVDGSVNGVLEWDGAQVPCIIESASSDTLSVRARQAPPVGTQVRAFIAYRAVVDDSTRDLPIRVLGSVKAVEPLRTSTRVTVQVKVARPEQNLTRLGRYLMGQNQSL